MTKVLNRFSGLSFEELTRRLRILNATFDETDFEGSGDPRESMLIQIEDLEREIDRRTNEILK